MQVSWLKVAKVSAGFATLAALVVYGGGLRQQIDVFSGFSAGWLLLAAVAYMVDRVVMTGKWWYLLRAQTEVLGFFRAHSLYQTCNLWGLAMPATIGGDALRVLFLRREGIDPSVSTASIVVERLAGLMALMLSVGLLSFVLRIRQAEFETLDRLLQVSFLGSIGIVVVGVFLSTPLLAKVVTKPLVGLWPKSKLVHGLAQVHIAFAAFGKDTPRIVLLCGLSVVEVGLIVLFYWILFADLGRFLSIDFLGLAVIGSFIVSRIPITFGGLGIFEASMAGFLALAGIPIAEALAASLVGRFLHICCWIPWVGIYLIGDPKVRV